MAEQERKDVLFEVRQENLETGMRGYPVGYCTTSSVDPQKGLSYRGILVDQMVDFDPYEVIFLLYEGHKGSEKEVQAFREKIKKRMTLKEETKKALRNLPRKGHPMKLFSAALLILAMLEGSGELEEDLYCVVAKIPLVGAEIINHHAGFGGTRESNPDLGYMENFVHILNVPETQEDQLSEVFRVFNILHYDHGGGNLSAFIGKGVASGLEDMYGSLVAAMCALAGPRHGKANQDSLEFVKEVARRVGDEPTLEKVEEVIRDKLKQSELIFGFGHAVLRVEDPRATIFYEMAKSKYPNHLLVKIASLIRKAGSKVLAENPKISDPHPNIDAISGTLLSAAGFPYPEYFTVLFGISRCIGIARQIVYERTEAREGKGTPIIRPKYFFKKQG